MKVTISARLLAEILTISLLAGQGVPRICPSLPPRARETVCNLSFYMNAGESEFRSSALCSKHLMHYSTHWFQSLDIPPMNTMYLDHIYPLFPIQLFLNHALSPPNSWSSFVFTEFSWCCPYAHGCRAIHWSMCHLLGPQPCRMLALSPPAATNCHQLLNGAS